MGCAPSSDASSAQEISTNAAIEKALKEDKLAQSKEVKILLLGAGESGKSTVVKQFRKLNGQSFTQRERDDFRGVIFSNLLGSIFVVLSAFETFQLTVPIELKPSIDQLISIRYAVEGDGDLAGPKGGLDTKTAQAVSEIWSSECAKLVVSRATELQLNDSAAYFFDAVDRLKADNYQPTDTDILRARVKSTGITEARFKVKSLIFNLVDVGGQRSERKKWIHCFENVNVLIFVIAISEYPQRLYEDESVGRMDEALTLWRSISASRWFARTDFILFLNKIDLFKQRLAAHPFAKYKTDYPATAPNTYEATTGWLVDKLEREFQARGSLHVHLTCATDEEQVQLVLHTVTEGLFRSNLERSGLL